MKIADTIALSYKNVVNSKARIIRTVIAMTVILVVISLLYSAVISHRKLLVDDIVEHFEKGIAVNYKSHSYSDSMILKPTPYSYDNLLRIKGVATERNLKCTINESRIETEFMDYKLDLYYYDDFDREIVDVFHEGVIADDVIWITQDLYDALSLYIEDFEVDSRVDIPLKYYDSSVGVYTINIEGIIGGIIQGDRQAYQPMDKMWAMSKSIRTHSSVTLEFNQMNYREYKRAYNDIREDIIAINDYASFSIDGEFYALKSFDSIVLVIFLILIAIQLIIGINSIIGNMMLSITNNSKMFSLLKILGLNKRVIFIICLIEMMIIWLLSTILSLIVVALTYKPVVLIFQQFIFYRSGDISFPILEMALLYGGILIICIGYIIFKRIEFKDDRLLRLLRSEE